MPTYRPAAQGLLSWQLVTAEQAGRGTAMAVQLRIATALPAALPAETAPADVHRCIYYSQQQVVQAALQCGRRHSLKQAGRAGRNVSRVAAAAAAGRDGGCRRRSQVFLAPAQRTSLASRVDDTAVAAISKASSWPRQAAAKVCLVMVGHNGIDACFVRPTTKAGSASRRARGTTAATAAHGWPSCASIPEIWALVSACHGAEASLWATCLHARRHSAACAPAGRRHSHDGRAVADALDCGVLRGETPMKLEAFNSFAEMPHVQTHARRIGKCAGGPEGKVRHTERRAGGRSDGLVIVRRGAWKGGRQVVHMAHNRNACGGTADS